MEYFWTCLISGAFCWFFVGPECGLTAVVVGVFVVKVVKSIMD